jgi:hypothetical protein
MRRIPFRAPCRLPWGLLGMLALVATSEVLITRSALDFSTPAAECWRRAGRAATRAQDAKILCFGTSLTKTGILPRLIEARTGQRTTNLAVFSGPIPASYYLLRRALEAGARPSALIVDCQNLAIPGRCGEEEVSEYLLDSRLWTDLLGVRECLDLAWATRRPDFFVKTLLSWTLPSVKARFEIRAAVLGALNGQTDSPREVIRVHQRNWAANRGTHVFPHVDRAPTGNNGRVEAVTVIDAETIPPDDAVLDTLTGAYARRLVALADAHRIAIYWLMPPLPTREQAKRTGKGEDVWIIRLARTLQVHARNLTIVDGRASRFDPGVFADAIHLDGKGAAIFSDAVGTAIARTASDPATHTRLVRLPRYRDVSPGPARVEDYSMSYLTLKARGLVR